MVALFVSASQPIGQGRSPAPKRLAFSPTGPSSWPSRSCRYTFASIPRPDLLARFRDGERTTYFEARREVGVPGGIRGDRVFLAQLLYDFALCALRCRQRRAPMPASPKPSSVRDAGSGTDGTSVEGVHRA